MGENDAWLVATADSLDGADVVGADRVAFERLGARVPPVPVIAHRRCTVTVAGPLMNGDFQIIAPSILTARAASNVTDVYMYQLSRAAPSTRSTFGGAAHTTEVPYIFDNLTGDTSGFEEIDRGVSRVMADAWVQFAKTGNPNGGALPQWPTLPCSRLSCARFRRPHHSRLQRSDSAGGLFSARL